MADNVIGFYESLADFYHLIFEDWDSAIERQAQALDQAECSESA
jgi:glycine/sarcosine N-methyltransferase